MATTFATVESSRRLLTFNLEGDVVKVKRPLKRFDKSFEPTVNVTAAKGGLVVKEIEWLSQMLRKPDCVEVF